MNCNDQMRHADASVQPFGLSTAHNRLLQVLSFAAGIKQCLACSMHTCCKVQHNLQPAAPGLDRMLKAMCIMLMCID